MNSAPIRQVCEIDPLSCLEYGAAKIIRFIERDQSELIEKILRHCRQQRLLRRLSAGRKWGFSGCAPLCSSIGLVTAGRR
jgi:hypothetical protein